MKILKKQCIDCGSPAIGKTNDDDGTWVTYECGAVLNTIAVSGLGKIFFSDCTKDLQVAAV